MVFFVAFSLAGLVWAVVMNVFSIRRFWWQYCKFWNSWRRSRFLLTKGNNLNYDNIVVSRKKPEAWVVDWARNFTYVSNTQRKCFLVNLIMTIYDLCSLPMVLMSYSTSNGIKYHFIIYILPFYMIDPPTHWKCIHIPKWYILFEDRLWALKVFFSSSVE